MMNYKEIKKCSATPFQKKILKVMHQYDEGWMTEETLEEELKKLFKSV